MHRFFLIALLCAIWAKPLTGAESAPPDFEKDVAPVLRRYCVGCHNSKDREGELALDTHAAVFKGGDSGAVITDGKSGESKLIRVLTGQDEPAMPPEGEPKPTRSDIDVIARWIDAGAPAPLGSPDAEMSFAVPRISPTVAVRRPIHAATFSPDGALIAIARHGEVELLRVADGSTAAVFQGHTGNVNAICFSPDGSLLAAGAGEPGVFGEVRIWSVSDGKLIQSLRGHQDSVYALDISPSSQLLATGSYDHEVKLWDISTGRELRTLKNHQGAVFGVAFHPGGHMLASASADRTVKLWNVQDGKRLDTFEQATQELYALAFYPDGKRLAAGGADNRIRIWSISDTGAEGANPIQLSRFGHEQAILRIAISRDGRTLVSTGEDRLVKIWDANDVVLRDTLPVQPDWVAGLTVSHEGDAVFAGRLDGSFETYPTSVDPMPGAAADISAIPLVETTVESAVAVKSLAQSDEVEPNDLPEQATPLAIPAVAKGRIFSETSNDVDLYRIRALAGQSWIIETNAARNGSPLDSKIEVLNVSGQSVPRVLLQATRDSWITFRGINSDQLDCRLVYWEEMQLNQFLYMNGEVCKLFRAPQGPDSGFQFYPGTGKRHAYFDTSAQAHALDEPCYIVAPFVPGSKLPNNGLPTFTLYYENDDERRQLHGKDSYLTFTAPEDGDYLVRVSDVRGFSGENFAYELTVRPPKPDFQVTLAGGKLSIGAESGKRFIASVDRIDGFDGEVRIDIENLPPGFRASTPLTIQAGQVEARGVINALPGAPAPTAEDWAKTKITASAVIAGETITHEISGIGPIQLVDRPKIIARLTLLSDDGAEALTDVSSGEQEVVLPAGTTVTCQLTVARNGFNDRIQFDIDNLPHGVIVDNIGLNGVLIPEGETSRTLYLTAADWVPETRRQFMAVAKAEGDQASLPLWLKVVRPTSVD
jgi:WD40 repeat protein